MQNKIIAATAIILIGFLLWVTNPSDAYKACKVEGKQDCYVLEIE